MCELLKFLALQVLCGVVTVLLYCFFGSKNSAKTCAGYYGVYLFGVAGTVLTAFLSGIK